MARQALSTKADTKVTEQRALNRQIETERKLTAQIERRRSSVREKHGGPFKGKKFKDLNAQQKDKLLAIIAIELGLLEDD